MTEKPINPIHEELAKAFSAALRRISTSWPLWAMAAPMVRSDYTAAMAEVFPLTDGGLTAVEATYLADAQWPWGVEIIKRLVRMNIALQINRPAYEAAIREQAAELARVLEQR